MMKKLQFFAISLSMLLSQFGMAQEKSISGVVTAAGEGTPIPGVNVLIKGTSQGTLTDTEGRYAIQASPENTLVFSFIGYTTQEIPVGNRSTIDVSLTEDVKNLNEVVVTAFGVEQQKRALGYAVQEVQSEDLVKVRQPNVVSALQGQIAGAQITSTGGAPGQSARVIIRGINSLDPNADNQPLFVVDGVPIDNSTNTSDLGGDFRGVSNRAADINPNDIESVNVLKGAAATALYGVRAANGAIIITTKKGKAGKLRVNLFSSVGIEEVNKFPDIQQTYTQGFNGIYDPDSFWPSWGPAGSEIIDTVPDLRFYNNWKNAMRTGVQFNNSVTLSGGNDNATYYASASNLQHKGVMPFSTWDRTSFKLAGDSRLGEKFTVSSSINYIISGGNRVFADRFMESLVYWSVNDDVNDYKNPDGTMKAGGDNGTNPVYQAENDKYVDKVNRLIGNINLNYKITDWLNLQYRLGTDYYNESRQEIMPGPLGIEGEIPLSSTGYMAETRINNRDINSTVNLTFNKKFGDRFTTTLRLGNDVFDRSYDFVRTLGEEFSTPNFFHLSNVKGVFVSQNIRKRRLVGVYGDFLLDYNNIVYLNITGRNDWSSTLPKQNRSFFYPSVNAGFIFNEVVNLPEFFTYSKVRASWAQVGKDASPYLTNITYTADIPGFPLNGQAGYTRDNALGESTLQPERTTTIELGADLRFLQNKLGLDFTFYKSNSKDQILSVPISNTTGFSTIVTNAGEIQNKGIEIILRASPVKTNNFSWDINLNFARNKNTVVDIREGIERILLGTQFGYVGSTASSILFRNQAYGNILGTSFKRYYAPGETEDPLFLDKDRPLLIGANGFPVIDTEQKILGNSQPDWYGGITNSLTFKDFNLSFLVDVRQGAEKYNQYNNFFAAFGIASYTLNRNETIVFDGRLADGSVNTKPVWLGQGVGPDGVNYGAGYYRNTYRRATEPSVEDASWVRLRSLSLTYNLPTSFLSKISVANASLSLTGNNLILITPYSGFDPEATTSGAGSNLDAFSGLNYPGVRSYFATLNVTF